MSDSYNTPYAVYSFDHKRKLACHGFVRHCRSWHGGRQKSEKSIKSTSLRGVPVRRGGLVRLRFQGLTFAKMERMPVEEAREHRG